MPSHFEAIGVKINSMEEMEELFSKCLEHGTEINTEYGKYYFWDMGNGAELWGQLDSDNEAGLNPHFSGSSSFKAILEREIKDEERPAMDGSLHCQSVEGQYPFAVDIPDMKVRKVEFPKTCSIQLSAFAHNVDIYESEEDYNKKNTSEPKFATEHFIPTGLFTDDGQTATAHAMFGGIIKTAEKRKNSVTGLDFYYALVKTLGGEIDVVISPDLIKDGIVLKKGYILSGHFWLSAKISG